MTPDQIINQLKEWNIQSTNVAQKNTFIRDNDPDIYVGVYAKEFNKGDLYFFIDHNADRGIYKVPYTPNFKDKYKFDPKFMGKDDKYRVPKKDWVKVTGPQTQLLSIVEQRKLKTVKEI